MQFAHTALLGFGGITNVILWLNKFAFIMYLKSRFADVLKCFCNVSWNHMKYQLTRAQTDQMMKSDSNWLKGLKRGVRREISLSLSDQESGWRNMERKWRKKKEWATFTLLPLSAAASLVSFCSYFCAVMDKSASSSQTEDKLAIKDHLHAGADSFVLSWPVCVLVIIWSQWISTNYLFFKVKHQLQPRTSVISYVRYNAGEVSINRNLWTTGGLDGWLCGVHKFLFMATSKGH